MNSRTSQTPTITPSTLADTKPVPRSGSASERLVAKLSAALPKTKSSRRSFLTRTAVVGSALAVNPIDFVLKPASAYDVVCGAGNTCGEGWSVFCCTINGGSNSCPPGSFTGGWWKADNSSFCGGYARYYIDCNQYVSSPCGCYCPTGTCDNRRTCCNQFRYGQCNQQIGAYGPVRCRVVTCTPPWQFDASCSTSSATDNRTASHNAPCNNAPPPPPPPPPPPGANPSVSFLGLNADGRMEAFAIGTDGAVWHDYQVGVAAGWSGWGTLGGNFAAGSPISIAANQDGRLEIFVLGTDGRIWHQWQVVKNGPWSGFYGMGPAIFTQAPTVGRNADGRLEVFTVGNDGRLWHAWQHAANGPFSDFAQLGGNFSAPPVLGRNHDGRLEVFCVGNDGGLWHSYQVEKNNYFSSLSSMGGSFQKRKPAIGVNADGRLQIFLLGTDASLRQAAQVAPNSYWTAFTSMGGLITHGPAVGRNADGRLEVFVVGLDGQLFHSWQNTPGGGWSSFSGFGGSYSHPPAVISNVDGRLEWFTVGTDGTMYHAFQVARNSYWSDTYGLGGTWT